jgi:hypothetical protein
MSEPRTGLTELRAGWAMAPAALLRNVMAERGFTPAVLTAACARAPHRTEAELAITAVLHREPLTVAHAGLLARGTLISADCWLAVEHDYRMGLACGLPDVTGGRD